MSSSRSAARTVAAFVAIWISACAGVTVHKEKADPSKDNGIRYYEPAPFLLIYSDSKGGLTSKLVRGGR